MITKNEAKRLAMKSRANLAKANKLRAKEQIADIKRVSREIRRVALEGGFSVVVDIHFKETREYFIEHGFLVLNKGYQRIKIFWDDKGE